MSSPRLIGLVFLVGAAGSAAAETFTVDAKKSELMVRTFKAGVARGLAHDHLVVARDVQGELSFDPEAPEATRVSVTVKVASLVADDPAMRRRFKVGGELSEKDRQKVTASMLDEGQLDAARFPTISFVSTGAEQTSEGLMVSGRFTLHGVTKPLRLPVKISSRDGALLGVTSFKLLTSDYGIKPYSAALGTVKNQDQVELVIRLVGVPAK